MVKGGVAGWVDAQMGDKRSERDEIRRLLPTVDDPQFQAFYEEEVARLDALLEQVDPNGPLVFAVVVRAPSSQLQALRNSHQVRLVDVASSSKLDPDDPVRGLRPEETIKANDPPTRPT